MVKAQRRKMCPVIQEDEYGHIVGWYRTVADAVEQTGIRHIHSALYRNGKAGGFNWKKISEGCFKALAAMNDEDTSEQWFVNDLGVWRKAANGTIDLIGYTKDQQDVKHFFRKATAEEIIEHFKNK